MSYILTLIFFNETIGATRQLAQIHGGGEWYAAGPVITSFCIPHIFLACQNPVPTLPTMQLDCHERFQVLSS